MAATLGAISTAIWSASPARRTSMAGSAAARSAGIGRRPVRHGCWASRPTPRSPASATPSRWLAVRSTPTLIPSAPSAPGSVTRSIARSGTSPAARPGSATRSPSPRPASAPQFLQYALGLDDRRRRRMGVLRQLEPQGRISLHRHELARITSPASSAPRFSIDPDIHTVKVGLNYRFGGGGYGKGPVVAKY